MPTDLHFRIFWRVTYDDIKTKIRLYMGREQARIVQDFETFAKVASLALGGGSEKDKEKLKKEAERAKAVEPKSFEELAGMFGGMFTVG